MTRSAAAAMTHPGNQAGITKAVARPRDMPVETDRSLISFMLIGYRYIMSDQHVLSIFEIEETSSSHFFDDTGMHISPSFLIVQYTSTRRKKRGC
jgi:hypothetical protein